MPDATMRRLLLGSHAAVFGLALVTGSVVAYLVSDTFVLFDPRFLAPFLGVGLALVAVLTRAARELRGHTLPIPTLPLAFGLGNVLYLILAPVPSIRDPSYLIVPEAARHYAGAYFTAGLGIAAYMFGAVFSYQHRPPILLAPAEELYATRRSSFVLGVGFAALYSFVWLMRIHLGATGYFSIWRTENDAFGGAANQPEGSELYLYYALFTLRWTIIPYCEHFRRRSRTPLTRGIWTILSVIEIASYVISNEREAVLLALAQLGLARAHLNAWTRRRLVLTAAALAASFFLVINPAVYLMREHIVFGRATSQNQLTQYSSLFYDALLSHLKGRGRELTRGSTERDVKYRLNALAYVSALIGADAQGRTQHGWGEYSLRNAATVVPAFLWPSKRSFAISNMKLEVTPRLGVPRVDYVQTLVAHGYAEFGLFGIPLFMFLAGLFDARISDWLRRRWDFGTIRIFYLALLPSFFSPVEDFAGHFLLKYRELVPVLALLYLLERWAKRFDASSVHVAKPVHAAPVARFGVKAL